MRPDDDSNNAAEKDIAALSNMALQHYQEGNLKQARDDCQRILRVQPRPDAILILAKIAHELRDFEEAAKRYSQFLEIVPNHEQTHYYLGAALEELGQFDRAIGQYQQAIAINANNAEALGRLADSLSRQQRWEEAIGAYQRVLALRDDDAGTMVKLGNAFTETQLFAEAILIFERAVTVAPDDALVHRRLGASLQRTGQVNRAIACFEEALRLRPDFAKARIDLARALRQVGRAEEAIRPLEEAVELDPEDTDAQMQLSSAYRQLAQTGRAVERLEHCLAIEPTCGEAYYRISVIRPVKELIPVIEKVLGDDRLQPADAIYCHFALGNLLDNAESYDRAFEHYRKANTLQRATITYDAEETRQVVDRFINVYSQDFFQGKREFGSPSLLPVFIVGMPRSGTTLIEQILSSHARVHGAGETESFPGIYQFIAQELNYVKPNPECMSLIDGHMIDKYSAQYLQEMAHYCPTAARITDKLPQNFFAIGLIKTLLPNAHIIHCHRDPMDNCTSLFLHYFPTFKATFDLAELGHYYLQYQRLMSHWENLFPGEIFTVRYEDLVTEQERVTRQLVDYIGLDWDDNCLDFQNNKRNVLSPSNMQVRQPIYKSSIGRWRLYEKQLQPLIGVLQATAQAGDSPAS